MDNDFSSEGHRILMDYLLEYAEEGNSVLDVGCGDCDFLRNLTEGSTLEGLGVDPTVAESTNGSPMCRRLKAEEINNLSREFDLIYSVNSLHHFDDPELFIKNLPDTLSDHGTVLLADWRKGASTGRPENYYAPEYIRDLLTERSKVAETMELDKQFVIIAEQN